MRSRRLSALLLLVFATLQACTLAQNTPVRERIPFDRDWRFALGNSWNPDQNFGFGTTSFTFGKAGQSDGPASPRFDDRAWRLLNLPHDWAVELPFDQRGDGNHGSKAIGRNFPQNSTGWYRKTFTLPAADQGRRIGIDFEGAYRDSRVWINGFYLGNEPSGYTGFHYDMTDYLNYGGSNVLVVEADATREEGWFYEGAGIYRHVWLTKTEPLHIAHDGTSITTTVADPLAAHPSADVTAVVTLENSTDAEADFTVDAELRDATGNALASSRTAAGHAPAAGSTDVSLTLSIPNARLWSLEDPYLHTLVTTVHQNGKVVDRLVTSVGIRTLRFDPNQGFFLNEKHVELKGTNDHQDHAGVGVALPDDLNTFRVERLKAMGSNAIRTAHNPPTSALLDACDRLGMLVIDENRLMGDTPEVYGQLRRLILRDRNHPSVILWSVGNEEWALEWTVFGERITRDMQAYVKRLDPTRRETIALSGSGSGNSLSTDVFGFNYYIQHHMDAMHARFPDRPVVGTEESSSEHTRGIYADDRAHQHLVAYDFEADGQHASVEDAWNYHRARPYSSGLFYWTGFDYRGETTPFGWPAISSQFGMLDTCGFFKDNAYLLQSWWTEPPMVHLLPHWTWPGREGQPIDVRVYSNASAIELSLNGKSLGRKPMPPNSHLEWKVAYQPGKLVATGYDPAGKRIASDSVETASAPAKLDLIPNTRTISANGTSLSIITVAVKDAQNRPVPEAASLVSFELSGPGKIIGVGNGDPASHDADTFVESVQTVAVTGWKTRALDAPQQTGPEIQPDFDDAAWEKARDPRWDEHRVDPPASVFRGAFDLPQDFRDDTFTLLLRPVGNTQSIYVNGHPLAANLPFSAEGYAYLLARDLVHPGHNVVTLYNTRFTDANRRRQAFRWSDHGPAAVRELTPPAPWRRSVFNGLAQIIVQATDQPGVLHLTASSPGLAPGSVILTAVAPKP